MRFGLATALMAGSYYLYDHSTNYAAQSAYWYDEYDNGGFQTPGYLGAPLGRAFVVDPVSGTNLLQNGGFELADTSHVCAPNEATGLDHWCMEDHLDRGTVSQDCTTAHTGSCSMRADLSSGPPLLYYQFQSKSTGLEIRDGDVYTLSFWGKAQASRALSMEITRDVADWEVFTEHREAALSTDWQFFQFTLHVHVPAGVLPPTPQQTRFAVYFAQDQPTVWLDDIKLQAGAEGVYRRNFEHGIVLINTLDDPKPVELGGVYRHIRGWQDPTVNTGALSAQVMLPGKDGLIMTNLIHAIYLPLVQRP